MNDSKMADAKKVTRAWQETLKKDGYDTPEITAKDCKRFRKLSRAWRRILHHTGLSKTAPVSALEFGSGGGAHLVPLFVNGWNCTGIDCSNEVIARANGYVDAVRQSACAPQGSIQFVNQDFIDFIPPGEHYDLTYQFGVLEHFLNDADRLNYVQKMFDVTRVGGYVVSAVPNGGHALRRRQREEGLGGYLIPEIDYTREHLIEEMQHCGAGEVIVLAHDLFGYLKMLPITGIKRKLLLLLYLFMQLPVFQLLPVSVLNRHAFWWVVVAKKV